MKLIKKKKNIQNLFYLSKFSYPFKFLRIKKPTQKNTTQKNEKNIDPLSTLSYIKYILRLLKIKK